MIMSFQDDNTNPIVKTKATIKIAENTLKLKFFFDNKWQIKNEIVQVFCTGLRKKISALFFFSVRSRGMN